MNEFCDIIARTCCGLLFSLQNGYSLLMSIDMIRRSQQRITTATQSIHVILAREIYNIIQIIIVITIKIS